jgi:hypothetical protein
VQLAWVPIVSGIDIASATLLVIPELYQGPASDAFERPAREQPHLAEHALGHW